MADPGTCTQRDTNCMANHFCPATDHNTVACKPCTEEIAFGQGCHCKDNIVTTNCQECNGTTCSTCLLGTYLSGNACKKCSKGCGACTKSNSCEKCADRFVMERGKCVKVCNSNDDCDNDGSTFCEISSKRCVKCGDKCDICSSAMFCNACDGTTHITTIAGQCTPTCKDMEDGKYCKNGMATACVAGLDSACQCGFAFNCASCTTSKDACETCLPNVVKGNNGACNTCAVGYKFIGDMCWADEKSGEVNRIGTGVIVGIVVGVLAVVGAVGSCLAFYLIKKAKK
ncbi:Cysteine-rich membrane protein 1 [Spironucleus salmonicida]|uniref:Cysteine-rich membrane protein 1 n=1 Tax=Spironucleus salmonicida TaxID=348837 RepID=A0A9P8RUK6_9EUKA|nr:Cysteine-rich membrane protein 1 [Spironucleus salmonicida]KAH0569722.1 Cysteine-rich membrane protein 1 [Spironucleus salmonicida]